MGGLASAFWTLRRTSVAQNAEAFRDAVQELVGLRIQTMTASNDHAVDSTTTSWILGALNNKRQLHKTTAAMLEKSARRQLTADDYTTLGYEHEADAEFFRARDNYLKAVTRADVSMFLQRTAALRSIGMLLLRPTAVADRQRGEAYLREALTLTSGRDDDYSLFQTGFTYELLGGGLGGDEGQAALDQAVACYRAMTPGNPMIAPAIERCRDIQLRLRDHGLVAMMAPSARAPVEPVPAQPAAAPSQPSVARSTASAGPPGVARAAASAAAGDQNGADHDH